MASDDHLPSLFVNHGKYFFEKFWEIDHTWTIHDSYSTLTIPLQSEGGFEIYVQAESEEIMISCGGFHEHYPAEEPHEDFINHIYGFLYNLLSPVMRVVEFRSGVAGYKWQLQNNIKGSWEAESTNGLIFFNFLAKRTTKILSNSVLPIREKPIDWL